MTDKFYYYSKSANAKPGQGTNERGNPDNYKELQKYEFRKVLSNFYEFRMKIDGLTWLTVEHYYQANKFLKNNPTFYYLFAIESYSDISKDPVSAKSAGGKTGCNLRNREICMDPDYFDGRDKETMRKALWTKFSQNGIPKQVLLATKNAELWHGTRGVPETRQYMLEEIRSKISLYEDVYNYETFQKSRNNYATLANILLSPLYNPMDIIGNIPIWLYIISKSTDNNLIHYILNDDRIILDKNDLDFKQHLLSVIQTKNDQILTDRILKAYE